MNPRAEYMKAWRKKNLKHVKAYNSRYRKEHKDELKTWGRHYRKSHPTDKAEVSRYNKEYRKLHKEEGKAYREGYRKRRYMLSHKLDKNKKAKRMLMAKGQQCRIKGTPFNLILSDICPLPTLCPVLGMRLNLNNRVIKDNSPTLDRINPKRGYVRGNVKVISALANRLKSNGTVAQLTAVLRYMKKERQQIGFR